MDLWHILDLLVAGAIIILINGMIREGSDE